MRQRNLESLRIGQPETSKKGHLSFDAGPKRYYILWLKMMFRAFTVFACLLMGIPLIARGQSSVGEEPILITSPDGQTVSNALLPAAQSPQPRQPSEFSSETPSVTFGRPYPGEALPQPGPVLIRQKQNRLGDADDPRKQMGVMTATEIMGVPSVRQIFGLPESNGAYPTNNAFARNTNTNSLMTEQIAADDSSWAKVLVNGGDGDAARSARTDPLAGIFTEIFSSQPNENAFSSFGKKAPTSMTGPRSSYSLRQQQSSLQQDLAALDASSQAPETTMPARDSYAMKGDSSLDSLFSAGLNSSFDSPEHKALQTALQLPEPPTVLGRREDSLSKPAPPSWAPKPPPWLLSGPQLGVMPQQKF